ncbi:MAG TPA: SRPBCC domain-containing protein [Phenylobacterium sp.]
MAIAEVLRATATITIKASPERCFDAWLDPAMAARFMSGRPEMAAVLVNEPIEGGAFRLTMTDARGTYEHEGRYVLIERPRRLVFTWLSLGTQERLSLVSITFAPSADGVRIDLLHEGVPDDVAAREHTQGWAEIMTNLKLSLEA